MQIENDANWKNGNNDTVFAYEFHFKKKYKLFELNALLHAAAPI